MQYDMDDGITIKVLYLFVRGWLSIMASVIVSYGYDIMWTFVYELFWGCSTIEFFYYIILVLSYIHIYYSIINIFNE